MGRGLRCSVGQSAAGSVVVSALSSVAVSGGGSAYLSEEESLGLSRARWWAGW